jgi:hypothetical protein
MNSLTNDFWKHVSTVGGPADLRDVFLVWAADQHMTIPQAEDIWKLVSADVDEIFSRSKKVADIEVTWKGPAKELADVGIAPEGEDEQSKEKVDALSDDIGSPEGVTVGENEEKKEDKKEDSAGLLDFPEMSESEAAPPAQQNLGGGATSPVESTNPDELVV